MSYRRLPDGRNAWRLIKKLGSTSAIKPPLPKERGFGERVF
jgi:hypothetical protein